MSPSSEYKPKAVRFYTQVQISDTLYVLIRLPSKPLYSMQTVNIVGFGDTSFENAIRAITYISTLFEYSTECKATEPYVTRMWRNQPIVSASNRYFTLQSVAPHKVLTSFSDEIDPKKLLTWFAQSSMEPLVNLEENEVKYFERYVNTVNGR